MFKRGDCWVRDEMRMEICFDCSLKSSFMTSKTSKSSKSLLIKYDCILCFVSDRFSIWNFFSLILFLIWILKFIFDFLKIKHKCVPFKNTFCLEIFVPYIYMNLENNTLRTVFWLQHYLFEFDDFEKGMIKSRKVWTPTPGWFSVKNAI